MHRDARLWRSVILTYHSVDESGSVISTSPALFESQMRWLAASGLPVVPLRSVLRHSGALALPFDDASRAPAAPTPS
jgi:hypothetical protein